MNEQDEFAAPDEAAPPVEIPWTALSPEALTGVIDSFVLREGTDYGARELTHEEKVAKVMVGLQRGEVQIMFDAATSSVTLIEATRSGRARS